MNKMNSTSKNKKLPFGGSFKMSSPLKKPFMDKSKKTKTDSRYTNNNIVMSKSKNGNDMEDLL